MTFDAGTWWLAVLLLGFVTAGLVYLLKRSLFGRIDKLDESMKEISENSVKKSDYESTVQSLQADIKQIRADYTPRAEHRKDLDECRGDIKQIKADYITKEDFFREQAIKVYDRPTALFYLDPPYVNTEKYYDSPFSAQDHHRLREVLSQVKGRFILSYNDHPLIRELYADYRIEGITRTTTLAGKGNNQTQYAELIIRNF